jgi:hypothetical protein
MGGAMISTKIQLATHVGYVVLLNFFSVRSTYGDPVYPMADKGYVLIECEDLPHSARWLTRTEVAGYTGSGYLHWNGPCQSCECLSQPADDHHNDITVSCQGDPADWLVFTVHITQIGRYTLDVRNWHPNADGANDAWMASTDTSMRVSGASPGADLVIYRVVDTIPSAWSWCTSDLWRWNSYAITVPGFYTFYLAARSTDFNADRIAVKRAIGDHLYASAAIDPLTPATQPVERSSLTAVQDRPAALPGATRAQTARRIVIGLAGDAAFARGNALVDVRGRLMRTNWVNNGAGSLGRGVYVLESERR